ncbi:MAG TPA: hypothetical protein VMU04_00870 [Candidatus Acidoferrum sp.]|nr:hypothetical protein [Candidatus Acidoferrum sp.]
MRTAIWFQANGLPHTSPGQGPGFIARFNSVQAIGLHHSIHAVQAPNICRSHQEEPRRTWSFQEEYRNLLQKYHLEFDERYVWD